jgi:hypothetical protein
VHPRNITLKHHFRSSIPALFAAIVLASCSKHTVQVPGGATMVNDGSFLDLKAGERLKVVVPLLKPGQRGLTVMTGEAGKDGTLVLSADTILGYQSTYYAIVGRPDGTVRLRFQSAETTKDGVKTARSKAPELPFALPERRQHVRLIYLVRRSRSDHNMAIVASRSLGIINTITERLKDDPKLCTTESEVFCSWVPAGVAVRAEPSR